MRNHSDILRTRLCHLTQCLLQTPALIKAGVLFAEHGRGAPHPEIGHYKTSSFPSAGGLLGQGIYFIF